MTSMRTNVATLACVMAVTCACSSDGGATAGPSNTGGGSDMDGGTRGGEDGGPGAGGTADLPDHILTGTPGTMPCGDINSGFTGDELCILPVEDGLGAHFHAGPADYDDPDEVDQFVLEPGEETTEYYVVEGSNEEAIWFRDQHYRMRPGSHHLIMYGITPSESGPPDLGWIDREDFDRAGPIGGTQVYAMDFPEAGNVAPEDVNLARPMEAKNRLAFEMHYVNATDDAILREAWVNLMASDVPPEDREILGAPFLIGAQFSVPPQTTQIVNYEQTIGANADGSDQEMRIVSLFGHRHASTSRFSIWLNRDGERDLVYEDYDWAEAREFFYNSVIENPTPDPELGKAGAASGQLFLKTGDTLEWECEMTNTLDTNLTFGNGVYVKEMCNVFGTLTSSGAPLLYGYPPPTTTTL